MKHKEGDKVVVREDLEVGKEYGRNTVVPEMLKFRGKEVTIKREFKEIEEYFIEEDDEEWFWTDEMFKESLRRFEFVERVKEIKYNAPKRNTSKSAGYDFYNPERVEIKPKEIKYVKTGIKAYMEDDEMLMLCNRSSNPKKKGLVLVNGIGIVDADYVDNEENEGEIAFAFMNITEETVVIEAGDKLGQGIFVKYGTVIGDEASGKRIGGFGTTGV